MKILEMVAARIVAFAKTRRGLILLASFVYAIAGYGFWLGAMAIALGSVNLPNDQSIPPGIIHQVAFILMFPLAWRMSIFFASLGFSDPVSPLYFAVYLVNGFLLVSGIATFVRFSKGMIIRNRNE